MTATLSYTLVLAVILIGRKAIAILESDKQTLN